MQADDLKMDELELAQAAYHGDDTAWRRIYDDTCQPLFNFLCYQTGDRDAAKDLLQDTYVTALARLDSFRGEGTLLGWLRAVALRKCLDWRRQVSLRLRKMNLFAWQNFSALDQTAEEAFPGLGEGFQAVLNRLSSRQRAALLLRELEDQSFAQIADSLGCGEPTARVHYHRACRNMKVWLQESDDLVFGSGAEGTMS